VVRGVLARREGLPQELANEVARRLDGVSQDVRDAIRVARLAPQLGIDRAIKLLIGGESSEK
jgi:Holliday junction DNA helicase RuvB